jgi:hypothetical protein
MTIGTPRAITKRLLATAIATYGFVRNDHSSLLDILLAPARGGNTPDKDAKIPENE